jgi:tetratricopeptide (TPR) repeat protein
MKIAIGKEKDLFVPVRDLVKVTYETPAALKLLMNPIFALEEKRDYAKALEEYKALTPRMGNASDRLKRYVEYRIAVLKAAQGEADAPEALAAFLKAHPNSWQFSSVSKQLAAMQMQKGRFDDAARTVEALTRAPGLSKDLKQEAELLLIDVLFRGGKFAEVSSQVKEALATLPANDPQRAKLEVYQIGCDARDAKIDEVVKKLEGVIVKTEDPSLKALAYNTLGDCYVMKGNKQDAKFAYLWVDAVYNQDRAEHAKALERLANLFQDEALNDPDRAAFFRDKAQRVR